MLTLRKRAWHARLHIQAYVNDREWLDHPVTGDEWREKSAERAAAVRARIENGFMSICPYFWKTVYALVMYCFVAVPMYAIRNFLRANWHHVPAFMVGVLITALIGGVWWVRGDIVALPGKIAEWHRIQEVQEAESRALHARLEKKRLADEAYLRLHPKETARMEARMQAWSETIKREREAKEVKKRAEDWAHFMADLAKVAPWLIGVSLAITLLFTFTPLLNLLLATFVLLVMIPLEKTRWGRALLELFAALFWWWVNLSEHIWRAMKTFVRDTWQFLHSYVMAVKKRVCPYITFVDGQTAT